MNSANATLTTVEAYDSISDGFTAKNRSLRHGGDAHWSVERHALYAQWRCMDPPPLQWHRNVIQLQIYEALWHSHRHGRPIVLKGNATIEWAGYILRCGGVGGGAVESNIYSFNGTAWSADVRA